MFFSLSLCTIGPIRGSDNQPIGQRKIHYAALGADLVAGVALLIIGICATHWGFLPSSLQDAFIGAGSAYSLALFSIIGFMIKQTVAPRQYLVD